MANTEIDSLSLDISIRGLNKEDIANIDRLSRAVQRLTKSLKDADFSKLKDIQVPKGIKNIQFITQNIKDSVAGAVGGATSETMAEATELLGEYADGVSDVAVNIEDSSLAIEKADNKVVVSNRQAKKALSDLYAELNGKKKETAFEKMLNRIGKTLKRIKTIAFIKAIRGILNAIVSAIKIGITNLAQFDKEFNDTISNIKTAGTNISDSIILAFRPVIESLEPFIVAFSKSLATIGNEVSRLQAIMKGTSTYTKINAKYMEDFANASKKAQKFSFDTFETLSGSETNNKFETAETTSDDEDKSRIELIQSLQEFLQGAFELIAQIMGEVKKILTLLKPIISFVLEIGACVNEILGMLLEIVFDAINPILSLVMELIEPLLDVIKPVMEFVKQILQIIKPIIDTIVKLVVDLLTPVIKIIEPLLQTFLPPLIKILDFLFVIYECVGTLISGAIELITSLLQPFIESLEVVSMIVSEIAELFFSFINLDFQSFAEHFRKLIVTIGYGIVKILASIVDSVVNSIIDAINLIFYPLNALSDFFGWGWEIGIPHINLAGLIQMPSFANGGLVGEVWQMNEYGNPEMLYNANNNSNNTAVINQAQLSLAFEQAIYNTGLLDAIARAGVINIDGKAIAQSTTFKNEINRTNPNLNIR